MTDCCAAIYDLGCVGFCDTISTGVTAPSTGTYTISVVGTGNYASYSFVLGADIEFTNVFNEDTVTIFKVIDPDGEAVERSGKECYQVKINPSLDLT